MVVDCDRPDVLETIGFRVFAVGTKPLNSEEIPFAYPRDLSHYISEVDTYFITQETFEYFFKNRKTSPNCFDYATSFEFQIVPLKTNIVNARNTHILICTMILLRWRLNMGCSTC